MQTVSRLVKKFAPTNYNLSITLNRTDRIFDGTVAIFGLVLDGSDTIVLHCKDLNIKSVVFDGKSAQFTLGDNDELVIQHKDINNGKHVLVIDYTGEITDSMHGLYPCYFEHDGVKKELLATQFESHHAREVFPCIDEPEAKATFDLTLATENNVIVLGNMPIKTQSVDNELLVTTFTTTPAMSTYLLAWVVGELHSKTAKTKSGTEVNIWATPAQSSDNLDFALDIATRTIDFFNDYFGVDYPLSKCDHVALPDFSSGAMENWGLITYREMALLADPSTTSITSKHYIATVITHELSHQWFGNLVTMKWWNDLWLNESFASLVEYTATDALEPNWNVWLEFASYDCVMALRRDSLSGVQPVQTDVNHPDEISTLFDGAIVYAKGARLLQMLQNYIGEDAFKAALRNYFQKFAYDNTEAKDLWNEFSKTSNKDIAPFMDTWISQPGYPVVHISRDNNQISISQQRLASKSSEVSSALWPIPLNSNNPDLPEILDTCCAVVESPISMSTRLNVGSKSHFITHYDAELFNNVILELKSGNLSPIDRLQLLNEQLILANAGIIKTADLIALLLAYKDESVESVWDIISMAIGELKKFVENDLVAEQKLRVLVKSLAIKQYDRLGLVSIHGESETDAKLRGIIIGLMIYAEDENVINESVKLFNSKSINDLDPELRSYILSATVRHSNDKNVFDKLLSIYKDTQSAELKQDICLGLTATKDIENGQHLLNLIKDASIIRTQDVARWLAYLIRNKYMKEFTWQWLRDNWLWIKNTFSGDKSYDEYPRYSATALSTRKQLEEYCDFFGPMKSDPALSRVIGIGINEITDRVELIERDSQELKKTLLDI